jgi:hypothetical protein
MAEWNDGVQFYTHLPFRLPEHRENRYQSNVRKGFGLDREAQVKERQQGISKRGLNRPLQRSTRTTERESRGRV